MSTLTVAMAAEYQHLYDTAQANPASAALVDTLAVRIGRAKDHYASAVRGTPIPWQWAGIVHLMECALDFTKHLHNGDPLSARTVHAPAGRPYFGNPPFTWEQSAKDALLFRGLHNEHRWDVPAMLFEFEKYNGMGYRARGVHSPYLWAGCSHYTAGKFTADGLFNSHAVSKQIGAGVVLRRLLQLAPIEAQGKGGADGSQSTAGPSGHGPIT
jgi:lysozyme family protein